MRRRPARLALAFTLLTRSASALHHSQRPKVLLVDCHDSYTHNVASWLHDAGATPEVVAADDAAFETALDHEALNMGLSTTATAQIYKAMQEAKGA